MLKLGKTKRTIGLAAATLTLAGGTAIGLGGTAHADSDTIIADGGNFCLIGHGWKNSVTIGGCYSGPNHVQPLWRWVPVTGTDAHGGRWWEVIDTSNGLCLDADTNTIGHEGSKVQEWSCNNAAQQHWYAWPLNGGGYEIINGYNTNYVLDCQNASWVDQTVYLWTANYQRQQEWGMNL